MFAQLTVKADMKQKGILDTDRGEKEFWGEVNEAAKKAVGLLDKTGGSVDAADVAERIEELFSEVSPSSGISYRAGDGEGEQNVDRSSTDEVVQDRIDFLEEEIRKSQEDLMELKQELDELREEKGREED